MAGKFGSASVWFLVDGYNVLSAKVKDLAVKVASKMEETTGLGDLWAEHAPVGRSSVTLTQGGAFFDTTAGTGIHVAMSGSVPASPQATERIICLGYAGNTIGATFVGLQGAFSGGYEVLGQNEALTKANVDYTITGKREHGVILQSLAAQTVDWNTEGASSVDSSTVTQRTFAITSNSIANPSVVTCASPHGRTTGDAVLIAGVSTSSPTINGERTITVISDTTFSVAVNVTVGGTGGTFVPITTQNGGAGYLQVTAFSGLSAYIAKVRDSVDDITYADLVTFADQPALGAQRVAVSGQVDRHLAIDGNVTGSGSVTTMAGFCRF